LGIPICLIKYEDLIEDTLKELEKMIKFIARIQKVENFIFDNKKVCKAVNQCSFQSLSKLETEDGFVEAREGRKFFKLGEKNNYKKILPTNIKRVLEGGFSKEMYELNYFF
jgi:hypothetical protein|tara:strand:- start:51 stop:383 length:333 start_codon:yes stop_codon:yes gene_type:complete